MIYQIVQEDTVVEEIVRDTADQARNYLTYFVAAHGPAELRDETGAIVGFGTFTRKS